MNIQQSFTVWERTFKEYHPRYRHTFFTPVTEEKIKDGILMMTSTKTFSVLLM